MSFLNLVRLDKLEEALYNKALTSPIHFSKCSLLGMVFGQSDSVSLTMSKFKCTAPLIRQLKWQHKYDNDMNNIVVSLPFMFGYCIPFPIRSMPSSIYDPV